MKLSSKGHYGLRAMLALAKAYGSGPVALAQIAEAERLSTGYLEQLVAKLRRAGLVQSTRGMRGGYRLACQPASVTVGEVLRALEGPIAPLECASEVANPGCCQQELGCPSKQVWERMRDSIALVLDSTTLADLCQQEASVA